MLEEKLNRESGEDPAGALKSLPEKARRRDRYSSPTGLAPRQSHLWVIDSAGLHSFALPAEEEIASQVRRYNDAIQRGENPIETGNESGPVAF
ncbi:MAG: hypothetical protein WDO73_12750 [Ignavibacteriota bacterium]